MTIAATPVRSVPAYAWLVFALTFGLLISDYMARQVLNAVFPLLKGEWNLSDGQLGLLSGAVAVMVGLLTFPLSLLADRWGRAKSLALMAMLWSLATLGCGLAENYQHMFIARFLVGVGEAAYGSVGIALVLSVFPASMRATLTGAFMAGGMFGSVLGMALGGVLAEHLGWRWSFAGIDCSNCSWCRCSASAGTRCTTRPNISNTRCPIDSSSASTKCWGGLKWTRTAIRFRPRMATSPAMPSRRC